jgi:hypothetical protein
MIAAHGVKSYGNHVGTDNGKVRRGRT